MDVKANRIYKFLLPTVFPIDLLTPSVPIAF